MLALTDEGLKKRCSHYSHSPALVQTKQSNELPQGFLNWLNLTQDHGSTGSWHFISRVSLRDISLPVSCELPTNAQLTWIQAPISPRLGWKSASLESRSVRGWRKERGLSVKCQCFCCEAALIKAGLVSGRWPHWTSGLWWGNLMHQNR